MKQLTLDDARLQRDAAIVQVATKAGAQWCNVAYEFLKLYAIRHSSFTPEEVTDALAAEGYAQPHDLRAWGPVYQKARRLGVIERSMTETYQRRFGHATHSFKWRSLIFGGGDARGQG